MASQTRRTHASTNRPHLRISHSLLRGPGPHAADRLSEEFEIRGRTCDSLETYRDLCSLRSLWISPCFSTRQPHRQLLESLHHRHSTQGDIWHSWNWGALRHAV